MTTKLKKNDELIGILRDAGIVTKEYANPSAAGNPAEFIISTIPGGRGILVKNSDMAKIEVATDKEHRQAVLIVKEGKRKVSRTVKFKGSQNQPKYNDGQIKSTLIARFPIKIPGSTMTVSDMKAERVVEREKTMIQEELFHFVYSGTVTATVTRTRKNTFLLGMDETSHFISVLPKEVKSVKAAHSLLRPKGLPASTVRQGEFFFVPVDEARVLKSMKRNSLLKIRNVVPLEESSAHHAQYAVINDSRRSGWEKAAKTYGKVKPLYIKGLIFDKRGYRHAPVDLGNVWHRVVRNKESMTAVPKGTRTARRYD